MVLGVVGVLMLATACVSKTGEPADAAAASTARPATTSPPTSSPPTSSPRTTVTPDAAILTELADILTSADVARFNERICPGTPHLSPVSSIGADYGGTRPVGIDTYQLPVTGETVAARLGVRPGEADLVVVLGLNYNTYSWCVYSTKWCPANFAGLPPFTGGPRGSTPALDELERTILCGH